LVLEGQETQRTFDIGPSSKILLNNKDEKETKDKKKEKNTIDDLRQGASVKVITSKENSNQVLQVRFNDVPGFGLFAFAMVLIFLTYGGWSDAAFVAAEVRNRRRNIPLALFLGTAGVTVIYLLVNGAYLAGLGFERAQESKEVAAEVLKLLPWQYGEEAMCILVMISALGAVNGLIFTSSRIYATLGADYSLFAKLGQWNARLGTPVWSLLIQMVISLAMVAAVGTPWGQEYLNEGLGFLGLEPVSWEGQGGFYSLLRCTAPVFWIFFLMTGLALFVLRINDRGIERPFRVPLFPILPLIFCATCGYMIYSGIGYAGRLGLVGAALVLAGLPLYVFSRRNFSDQHSAIDTR
jgi:amino acid transporter